MKEAFVIIFREKKPDANLKEISFLYSRLHLLFSDVAQAFMDWSLKREGIILEAGRSSVEKAKIALLEIDRVLFQLKTVSGKFKFDKRVLEERYQDELAVCQTSIKGMMTELNAVWLCGNPCKKEAPFGDTTNYKFIIKRLVSYMDRANTMSEAINKKTEIFNKANKDLPPLPVLQMIVAPPSWARNL
jgi:hypothetical protein